MRFFEFKHNTISALVTSLFEAAEGKNLHLEHVEDLIFNEGYKGAEKALGYIEDVANMLADGAGDRVKITSKWDGAPALMVGIDPADGKFFVGTKSTFAKDSKVVKSKKDIEKYYGDKEGLARKLEYALKYLPKLGIGNVLQGDVMFVEGDVEIAEISGEQMYVFTPNTITYAVPVESELGKKIAKAKIGIIFHTAYEGSSLQDMVARFGASVAGLEKNANVWFDDATYKDYTGVVSFTPDELQVVKQGLTQADATMKKIDPKKFDVILKNPEFAKYIKPFINQMVRGGEQVGDPTAFLKKFVEFYKGKMDAEIAKLKGGTESPAVQARIKKIEENEQFIADNANTLLGILAIYKKIVELKLLLLKKLTMVSGVGTFMKTDDGYKVVNPEGFVAIGHDGGAIKLVDRLEFSRNNFLAVKNWG